MLARAIVYILFILTLQAACFYFSWRGTLKTPELTRYTYHEAALTRLITVLEAHTHEYGTDVALYSFKLNDKLYYQINHEIVRSVFYQLYFTFERVFRYYGIAVDKDFHLSTFSPWEGEIHVVLKHRAPVEGELYPYAIGGLFNDLFEQDPEIAAHVTEIRLTICHTPLHPSTTDANTARYLSLGLCAEQLHCPAPSADDTLR